MPEVSYLLKRIIFTKKGQRYDLILDVKTNRPVQYYLRALNPNGIYVTVGGDMSRLIQALFLGPWKAVFYRKFIRIVALKPNKDLEYINRLFELRKLKPIIQGPYGLDEFQKAFELFGRGDHKGKIVISF